MTPADRSGPETEGAGDGNAGVMGSADAELPTAKPTVESAAVRRSERLDSPADACVIFMPDRGIAPWQDAPPKRGVRGTSQAQAMVNYEARKVSPAASTHGWKSAAGQLGSMSEMRSRHFQTPLRFSNLSW